MAMTETARYVQTTALTIAYHDHGAANAFPIVLVHGWPDDIRTWDAIIPPLVRAGYRVLTPYLRGFGPTRFASEHTPRSGQVAALASDVLAFMDALAFPQCVLVGHDWGARAAYSVAALHPERVKALVALAIGYGGTPHTLSALQARAFWYQWYFALAQGQAALTESRRDLCQLLWQTWSPTWSFTATDFEQTAASFDNPDFVAVTLHYYRHRWGAAAGFAPYEAMERELALTRPIQVPTMLLHGADDGAVLPDTSAGKAAFFTGKYERRILAGVGHFIPREQPDAVIDAILGL